MTRLLTCIDEAESLTIDLFTHRLYLSLKTTATPCIASIAFTCPTRINTPIFRLRRRGVVATTQALVRKQRRAALATLPPPRLRSAQRSAPLTLASRRRVREWCVVAPASSNATVKSPSTAVLFTARSGGTLTSCCCHCRPQLTLNPAATQVVQSTFLNAVF
jgi:hypothetical protein